ncbi:MAG: STAS domain-containing protein [Proteobacteria bacterium]|nr:STAS domain-containing protein [Pseudomonadota bacterium]MBU1418980.1 STAS domain-containing protein [Pseudomonadota bacterium]MBU1455232.1 STAS domain-containing protein [Pseudomonadota bacterium]
MEINGLQEQDIFIIRLSGRMDTATVQKFTDFIQENETRDSDKIILDMGKLEYVSSAGLRGLLTYAKKIEAKKGSLLLCSLEGLVKEVFELSGFNKIFTITADIDEARSRLH